MRPEPSLEASRRALVGALGLPNGTAVRLGAEVSDVPMPFVAVTRNVYAVPFDRPAIVWGAPSAEAGKSVLEAP